MGAVTQRLGVMLNPHKSSNRPLKTQGADETLFEAALPLLCFGNTVGLWSNRLSSNCKVSLSSSKLRAKPCHAQPQARLDGVGKRLKSLLLFSKPVFTHWGQLSFPPAVGKGLVPWLRQIRPPLRFILRKVVCAYACIKQTRNT